ncbi:MAG: DNA alkylation repair protein [Longimicrobiales bacterium]
MGIKAEASFSLKDSLFNAETLSDLTRGLVRARPDFDASQFERRVLARFPDLELKQRIHWIVDVLGDFLPGDFEAACGVLLEALPEPLDAALTDGDFGKFIWVVPGEYVARHGCTPDHLATSLEALRQATMRFSSEAAIRPFLKAFPSETMDFVREWAVSDNYHVRRLASEGIRPFLPWAARVLLPPEEVVDVLSVLHADPTRYVTRSVSNTLNDLSRDHAGIVLEALERWRAEGRQHEEELEWMTRHALRTLIKRDHQKALAVLGYSPNPVVDVSNIKSTAEVVVGHAFEWRSTLISKADQRLKITLKIYFLKANGSQAPKVFAVKDVAVNAGENVEIVKRQPFKPITTRVLYPGGHRAELVVNGQVQATREFLLVEPSSGPA